MSGKAPPTKRNLPVGIAHLNRIEVIREIIIFFLQYKKHIFINLKTITIFKRKGATIVRIKVVGNLCLQTSGKPSRIEVAELSISTISLQALFVQA